jgi:hypothetical protein
MADSGDGAHDVRNARFRHRPVPALSEHRPEPDPCPHPGLERGARSAVRGRRRDRCRLGAGRDRRRTRFRSRAPAGCGPGYRGRRVRCATGSGPLKDAVAELLGRRVDGRIRGIIMRATLTPSGIGHLEDPSMLDRVALAQGVGLAHVTPGDAVIGLAENTISYLQMIGGAVIVALFNPLLSLWLVAANLFAGSRLLRETSNRVWSGACDRDEVSRGLDCGAQAESESERPPLLFPLRRRKRLDLSVVVGGLPARHRGPRRSAAGP